MADKPEETPQPPQPSRDAFARRVIELVRDRFPLVKIARAEQPFSLRLNGQIASLENLYRSSLLKPEDLNYHVQRWAVELLRASEGTPDQGAGFDELRGRILPMILSNRQFDPKSGAMVSQPLIGTLHVAYAIDSDRTIAYIPQAQFESWGIDLEDLHETAIANLVVKSEAIPAHAAPDEDGGVSLIVFQTMDGFDASRLLLPSLHDQLRKHLGSPFAAGIPNRDILLCFRNDEENVTRLRQQISDDYLRMPHQVTDELLLVTPDGLAVLF